MEAGKNSGRKNVGKKGMEVRVPPFGSFARAKKITRTDFESNPRLNMKNLNKSEMQEQQPAQDQACLMSIATGSLGRLATILQLNIVWNADSPRSSIDEAGRVAAK